MSLRKGDLIRGFFVEDLHTLKEFDGEGIFLTHRATGCQVFHLFREDQENLFAFIFATPSEDNTGAAHILEHTVLSGSERFPLKDPFLSLMKGSVNTFLNAMTYPEKTVFPAASTVERDYFNLMEVYGDSVFFPLLKEETFMQEAHRLEPGEDGASIAGVVYSEMLGAYSSHETIVNEWSYRLLFPDTPYRFDSGGEPAAIPRLGYEDFKKFHERYYCPGNCRIFLYGNIPTEKQLAFLDEKVFSRFSPEAAARPPAAPIPFQGAWDSPREFFMTSPLEEDGPPEADSFLEEDGLPEADSPQAGGLPEGDAGEGRPEGDGPGKSTITMNWKTLPVTDPKKLLAMEILGEILLGNVGCPLYKAVVESGIGEDLAPASGLDTEIREAVFTLGVRGTGPEKKEEFRELVLGTLEELAEGGIPRELIQGAFHQVEFRRREIRGGVPFGLRLMDQALRGWLHGAPPWETMEFAAALEGLKEDCRADGRFFEKLIREAFLDNPHRTLLVVTPDGNHNRREEEQRQDYIAGVLKDLGEEGAARLEEKNRRFEAFQAKPDSPEDQAKIPVLHRDDLPRDISLIETSLDQLEGIPVYSHKLYTNGLVYLDLAFDVRGLTKDESSLLPLFSRLICSSGIPGLSYDQLALRLSLLTGGVYTFLEASPVVCPEGGEPSSREYLFFRIKLLEGDLLPAVDLLENMLLRGDIANRTRIKDLLLEQRNDFRSSVLPMGHSICALRGAARLSPVIVREEAWRGVEQFLFLNARAETLEAGAAALGEELLALREKVIRRDRVLVNITCEPPAFGRVRDRAAAFLDALPAGGAFRGDAPEAADVAGAPGGSWAFLRKNEALIFPSAVGFTARVLPAAMAGTEAHSRELLLGHYLKTARLWEEVRMKGGAYGVSASANGAEGLFSFTSYRDPDPARTLGVFRDSLALLAKAPMPPEELEKVIIAVVGKDTKPLSPGEKSMMGFRRDLYGITDDIRRKNRQRVLAARPEDLGRAAEELLAGWDRGVSVFLAGDEAAEKVLAAWPGEGFSRLVLPA